MTNSRITTATSLKDVQVRSAITFSNQYPHDNLFALLDTCVCRRVLGGLSNAPMRLPTSRLNPDQTKTCNFCRSVIPTKYMHLHMHRYHPEARIRQVKNANNWVTMLTEYCAWNVAQNVQLCIRYLVFYLQQWQQELYLHLVQAHQQLMHLGQALHMHQFQANGAPESWAPDSRAPDSWAPSPSCPWPNCAGHPRIRQLGSWAQLKRL